ncbi:MAG: VWA domain-containing protein [Patescibacteria group bacterium]
MPFLDRFAESVSFGRPEVFVFFYAILFFLAVFSLFLLWKIFLRPKRTHLSHYPMIGRPKIWIAVLFAATFAVLALAAPYARGGLIVRRGGVDAVVVLDHSISMRARDLRPSRLEVAKREIARFVTDSILQNGDRVALFTFGKNSYRKLYLTSDFDRFLNSLDRIQFPKALVGQESVWFTYFALVLEEVYENLDKQGRESNRNRIIFFFSDGANEIEDSTKMQASLDSLRRRGMKIYAIGVGTRSGVPLLSVLDDYVSSFDYESNLLDEWRGEMTKLELKHLDYLANKTGGRVYTIEDNKQSIGKFLRQVMDSERKLSFEISEDEEKKVELWWYALLFAIFGLILALSIKFY